VAFLQAGAILLMNLTIWFDLRLAAADANTADVWSISHIILE
jgi:hypothetical protein